MPSGWYIVGALVIVFAITFALRAVPFAALKSVKESRALATMADWMPAGLLAILAASTFMASMGDSGSHVLHALVAVAVTVAVHLGFGRRTLLSVGAGTLAYVLLVSFW